LTNGKTGKEKVQRSKSVILSDTKLYEALIVTQVESLEKVKFGQEGDMGVANKQSE